MSTTFMYHSTPSNNIVATLTGIVKGISAFLSQSPDHRERAYEEAYLAESTDRYDLEFRMRKQDRSHGGSYWSNGNNR